MKGPAFIVVVPADAAMPIQRVKCEPSTFVLENVTGQKPERKHFYTLGITAYILKSYHPSEKGHFDRNMRAEGLFSLYNITVQSIWSDVILCGTAVRDCDALMSDALSDIIVRAVPGHFYASVLFNQKRKALPIKRKSDAEERGLHVK
jgi:hypothetical protein